ncbi:MAG: DegV family protein [Clostridiales bacterium]|jgi:DegV family protein with EDD domain|nr:DegV family protein [Clostridiales bacterium]
MITIVTDSCAYFKEEEAKELNVKIVPANYTVNTNAYTESFSDCNGDFESLLSCGGNFTTSQPNIAAFMNVFEGELKQGNEVLCVTISSRLSGAFSTAQIAARQSGAIGKLIAADSFFAAGGQYLLVKEAAKLAAGGKNLAEIANALEEIRSRIKMVFTVDDITPLRKSGRIGNVRMSVGTILDKKPIFVFEEGACAFYQEAQGNADIIKKMVGMADFYPKEFVINNIGYNRLTANFYNVLSEKFPEARVTIRKAGPVMGVNAGLNAAALAVIGKP